MISFTDFSASYFTTESHLSLKIKALFGTQAIVNGDYRKATGRVSRGQSFHSVGLAPL
jgi:hypothetical protein